MPVLEIQREHRVRVSQTLSEGSSPRGAFFLMTALSTLIAAFGLLMDSTAVVIGAMLVAPLMTPILGMALALVQGNPPLMGRAMRAEAIGVGVAVGVATLLGLALPYFESTPEMLARTRPNLFDLLVALFAGLAGAYALMDEKLSPILPGVAISTAIVPPLANTGLCLALGSLAGAYGSGLLFLTNFLTILLASALVFGLCGMATQPLARAKLTLARRFGLAVLGFAFVGVLLGRRLGVVLQDGRWQAQVRRVLAEDLAEYRISELSRLSHRRRGGTLEVLAHVHAPRLLTPRQVQRVEERLEEELGLDVLLNLRMTLTRHVSSGSAIGQGVAETLDGFAFARAQDQETGLVHVAEQAVREALGERVGQKLVELQAFSFGGETVLVAEVTGVRRLRRSEVVDIQDRVQRRVGEEPIRLLVQQLDEVLGAQGRVRLEFTDRRPRTPEDVQRAEALVGAGRAWLEERGFTFVEASTTRLTDGVHVLLEVTGPRTLSPEAVGELEQKLARTVGVAARAYVRVVPEVVVSTEGEETLEQLLDRFGRRAAREFDAETRALIDAWR